MKNTDNIEKLFKETFEHFEADVNPNAWSNVQHGINSVPSGGTASSAAKFTVGKIIAGAVSVAAVAGSVWYFSQTGNNSKSIAPDTNQHQTEIVSKEIPQTLASENKAPIVSNSASSYKQLISSINSSLSNQNGNNQNNAKDENHDTTSNAGNQNSLPPNNKNDSPSSPPSPSANGNLNSPPKLPADSPSDDPEQGSTVTIVASPESGDVPLTVNFSNQGNASILNWDFGDGTTSKENTPTHTFTKPGIYTVILTAKNSTGSASDKKNIEVKSISAITLVPNVFTPNGDNLDDYFSIGLKNIASIDVTIIDIAGKTIYKYTTIEGKWDGKTTDGVDAPAAIYFYTILATGTDGVSHSKNGTVTLRR